ncbi:NUDIX domain-containing protein [Aureimonas sp. AU12]|uniref:NUDIX domain-containing protein n=1 Tax=Aureimonas sp. AU12 TaxID=1638161 RepID=UPI000785B3F0|nr:NUDIX domain-containing protein [Aureimonas sp. AU12]
MTTPRPVLAVSVALFRGDEVLLVLRGKPPFADLWSLPGGRVEFGERLEDAARRELREETGVEAETLVFARLHEAIDAPAGAHAVIAVYAALAEHGADAAFAAADDAADARFFPVSEVAEMDRDGRTTTGLADAISAASVQRRA